MHSALAQVRGYYAAHERGLAAACFAAGFLFDLLTLGRIDSWLTLAQQVGYLAVILGLLLRMLLQDEAPSRAQIAAVHFLLGSLLSLYTLFFFKSSSLLVSFAFLLFMVVLLLANERERLRALGPAFKFALLSLCLLSFAAATVPIAVGSMGLAVFLLSMLAGCLPLVGAAAWIARFRPSCFMRARRAMLVPLGAVLVAFLASYLLRIIPPVPLSLPFIGVYHDVQRTEQGYLLIHERPWWRFWHNGDQRFAAQPGDRVFVYFRLFSPARFSDEVRLRWYRKAGRWMLQDTIAIRIAGGREAGFRGYGVKTNYQSGEWKVQVETADGREIGRIYFTLQTAPPAPRFLQSEIDA